MRGGVVFASVCPKIYAVLLEVSFHDERCLGTFKWIYPKIETSVFKNIVVLFLLW